MRSIYQILSNPSSVVVFTYSPAGLGHLRVTESLYQGLPKEVGPVLLGSQDKMITFVHHLNSTNPLGKKLMSMTQDGVTEDIYTYVYRKFLRMQTGLIYQQMCAVLDERIDLPKLIIIVATHYGLAHQLAAIKSRLEKDKYVKILLAVQVTDDSPQHLWYVDGADIIFVPSEPTKQALIKYGEERKLKKVSFEVNPYPLSPTLEEHFNQEDYQKKVHQVDPSSRSSIHFSLPVSGAGVGTNFYLDLMDKLHHKSARFVFHVVSKETSYTKPFIDSINSRDFVNTYSYPSSRETIGLYENLYRDQIISLESTKPSEQAFKALFSPRQRGGVVLLFAKPIGRQEYDNLAFLQRHNLIPTLAQKNELFQKASLGAKLEENDPILQNSKSWRGLEIPEKPTEAVNFIWWCLEQKIFLTMIKSFNNQEADSLELGSNGVKLFWQKIAEYIDKIN